MTKTITTRWITALIAPPDHCADCSRPGNEAGAAAEAAYWAKAST